MIYYMPTGEMLVELKSLGISPNRTNELNNNEEISNLIENIKQDYIREYKATYNDDHYTNYVYSFLIIVPHFQISIALQ